MEINHPHVFQCDSNIVKNTYENNDNYLIEEKETSKKKCCIYFSSNDIYYPNNEEIFKNQLLKKNKYEWYNTRVDFTQKHIFIRDIQKQWYLNGINTELNSIEKVLSFLKKETAGYEEIITIGSSAGGFAAVLFGELLNANKILSFNGQFFLNDLLLTSNENINPIVFREKNNAQINQYYSLRNFITKPERIFYFHSKNSIWDINQKEHICDLGINIISFKTSHHGVPFLKSNLPFVINTNEAKLKKMSQKEHYPLFFSIKTEGFFSTVISFIQQVYKFYKKRKKK